MSLADTPLVRALPYPRQRRNRWLRRALIFATVVVFVDAVVGKSGLAQSVRARRDYAAAQAQLSELQAENAALVERARRLAEDPGAIEGLARKELGFLHPGEVVFVLTPGR